MSIKPILIVEDEADLLVLFNVTLKRKGYANPIIAAHGGDVAIEFMKEHTPEVVVLDLAMPHVNGNDVIHYILSEERLAATKVIVVTAVPMRLSEEGQARVMRTLIKPVSPRALEEAVTQALSSD